MVCRECRLKYGVEKLHCRRGSNVINYKETVKVIGDKDE